MKTHEEIDERSLALARAVAGKIDADPDHARLAGVRSVCRRWYRQRKQPAVREWLDVLDKPWEDVRRILLNPSDEGKRLRQSSPFCGILSPKERWEIYRKCRDHDA